MGFVDQRMRKKPIGRKVPDEAVELIADWFKVLSEPTRIRLLVALQDGEKSVSELVELVHSTQANVSRHLQTLAEAGLITRRKERVTVFYSISDCTIFNLCEHVCGYVRRHLKDQAAAVRLFPA